MKTTIIVAIALAAMMIIAGAYLVIAQSKQAAAISCSSCDNKCTEQSNCGSASCGALNGGTCNCSQAASCESSKCGGQCGIESCGCGCKG